MGFWHTGYIEHHEFSGLEDSGGDATRHIIRCDKCDKKFSSSEELQNHIFSEHKSKLPKLLIEGFEVTSESNSLITKELSRKDISFINCVSVTVDGVDSISDPEELVNILNTRKQSVVHICLSSEDDAVSNIKLIMNIASREEILEVGKVFWEIQCGRKLNRDVIENFINASSKYETVSSYYDGICEYLYGVLAKERSKESGLEYAEYEKKFEIALNHLKFYRSKLSNIIRGLILFNFNKFSATNALCPNSRLGYAANNLGDPCMWKSNFHHAEDSILSDEITEKIIQLCTLSIKEFGNRLQDILTMREDKDVSQSDRIKISILLAKFYYIYGEEENFKYHIRYLKNFPEFKYITKYLSFSNIGGN